MIFQFKLVEVDGSNVDKIVSMVILDVDDQTAGYDDVEEPFGDPCADRQLLLLLEKIFYWTMILVQNLSSDEDTATK